MKYILNQKDFNFEKFMGKYFMDFWKNIIDYVKSNNKKSEKGIFAKSYNIDFQKLAQSLSVILPKIKVGSYSPDKIADADNFFGMIFHPESPEDLRSLFAPVYLQFLETCNDTELPMLRYSFKYFVPLTFLGKNESERISLRPFIDRESEAIVAIESESGPTNVGNYLQTLLTWIVKNWDNRSGSLMQPLFEKLFSAIYTQAAEKTNWDVPQYRCTSPVTPEIHEIVCKFFSDLFEEDHNFSILVEKRKLNFIIEILRSSTSVISVSATLAAMHALIAIASNTNLSDGFESNELMPKVGEIAIDVFNSNKDPQVLTALSEFGYWYFLDKQIGSLESRIKMINQVLAIAAKFEQAGAVLMASLLARSLNSNEQEPDVWRCIVDNIMGNEIYSAIASKYAQLLAMFQFVKIFDVNLETIYDACEYAFDRNQRNKISTSFDFVAQYIRQIIKEPAQLIHEKVKLSWPTFAKFEQTLATVPFTPTSEFKNETEDIASARKIFLAAIERYSENESQKCRENGFAVVCSYYDMFARLKNFPPGIEYSHISAFEIASRSLFTALIHEESPLIQLNGLKVLSSLLLTQDLRAHISDEMLSHWYLILLFTILSNNLDVAKLSFECAVSSIVIGFKGSSILLPTMLKIAITSQVTTPAILSLLSSISLFRVSHSVPDDFFQSTYKKLSERASNLRSDWKTVYVQTFEDAVDGAMQAIDKLSKSLHDTNNEKLATACAAFIVDEVLQPEPNKEYLQRLLVHITDAAKKFSEPALQMFLSVAVHSSRLLQICPEAMYKAVDDLADISNSITLGTDPSFTFLYMQAMTNILVSTMEAGRRSASKFSDLLSRFIKESIFPSDYPMQIQQFAISAREMLAIFLGSYPFYDTPAFPSSRVQKRPDQPLTVLMTNGIYITPDIDEQTGNLSYAVQTRIGQFNWQLMPNMNTYDNSVCEMTLCPESGADSVISINENEQQQLFTAGFTDQVNKFADFFGRDYALDSIDAEAEAMEKNISEINRFYEEFTTSHVHTPAKPLRPNLVVEFPASAALNAVGLVDSRYPTLIKRTAVTHVEDSSTSKKNVETLASNTLKTDYRWSVKAALAYVSDSTMDQLKILATNLEQVSPRFKEFISLLGWNVGLKNFPCYSGGLDTNRELNGVSSIYMSGFDYETMYHVSPLMPSNEKDAQQVDKKKHVGNDHIQVLFVESDQEYDALTITSQFNFVTIIVYPLQNGLYRVNMHHRDGMKWFGPLHEPVVVAKEALSSLINSTISIAMTNLRIASMPYSHPSLDTEKKIQQMFTDYTEPDTIDYSTMQELHLFTIRGQ